MNDPPQDITHAINAVAAAPDATSQYHAIRTYFTPDASFIYPVAFVPSSPNSRTYVAHVYRLYRLMTPATSFTINAIGWTENTRGPKTGKLWVDLIQHPYMRTVTGLTGWRPAIEMHILLDVVRGEDGKWRVSKQEDLVSPYVWGLVFPGVREVVRVAYWVGLMMAMVVVWVAGLMGRWVPDEREVQEVAMVNGMKEKER